MCWEGLLEGQGTLEGCAFRYWQALVLELDVGSDGVAGWLSRNVVHQELDGEVQAPAVEPMLEIHGACVESVCGTLTDGCFQLETTTIVTTKPWTLPWARRRYSFRPEGFEAVSSGTSEVLAADADTGQGERLAISERPPAVVEAATSTSWQGVSILEGGAGAWSWPWRNLRFVCLFWDGEARPGGETSAVIYTMDGFKEIVGSPEPPSDLDPGMQGWLGERISTLEHASGTFAGGKLEISGTRVEYLIAGPFTRDMRKHYVLEATSDTATLEGTAQVSEGFGASSALRLFESPAVVLQLVPDDDLASLSCVMLSGEEKLAVGVDRDELMAEARRRIQVHGIPSNKLLLLLPSGELLNEAHLAQTVAEVFEVAEH